MHWLTTSHLHRQEKAARQKRQALDTRLKTQAAASSNGRKRKLESDGSDDDAEPASATLDIKNLPALLPEDILDAADDANFRMPVLTPQRDAMDVQKAKKTKFVTKVAKLPKDKRIPGGKLRVLGQMDHLLAPIGSKQVRNLKAYLLSGRGPEGGIVRRESGKRPFVRWR